MTPTIPDQVRELLVDHVDSFEKLEALLVLARHADERWTSDQMAERLHISIDLAAGVLRELSASGLVAVEEAGSRAVRYRPGTPGQASAVDELIRVYDSDRLAVMQILTANALGRLKRSAIVTFASAFRLKRKTDDEDDHG